jgi:glycosyltransferase involved in cell wall biosynthesis
VTPLHTTVPPEIPRAKIVELPWGAAVERFAARDWRLEIGDARTQSLVSNLQSPNTQTVVFLGSFRAWHGVLDFVRAAAMLLALGRDCHFLLIGDGPERAQAERLAATWPGRFTFTGAVPYEQVPGLLAGASMGVAPFNTAPHPALRAAGFFWSPLKVYEYMAAGLPVVTADIHPLNQVIRDGLEGALFHEGDIPGLAAAIARLLDDPAARAMGARARARVVEYYSWERHCAELERIALELV